MWKSMAVAVAVAVWAAPAAAQRLQAQNSPTADIGPGTFAVINKWAGRDDDIWCAAARGALRRGAGWKERLYVAGVTGARQSQYGSETITFTFRPGQDLLAQGKTGSSSIRGIGNSLTLTAANRRCQREPEFY
jgi:hypothetical protein